MKDKVWWTTAEIIERTKLWLQSEIESNKKATVEQGIEILGERWLSASAAAKLADELQAYNDVFRTGRVKGQKDGFIKKMDEWIRFLRGEEENG